MGARDEAGGSLVVAFGSASLLDGDRDLKSARLVLETALDAGADRLDTAPMYGHGLLEPLVLALGAKRGAPVTTKVGIEPSPPPPRWRRVAAAAARSAPSTLQRAARRIAGRTEPDDPFGPSYRFAPAAVRASVERSLRSAPRLDRLLLHEVQPPDVTDELLELLERYRRSGDVAELGCATRNPITEAVLERGAGVLTVAHVSTAPLGAPLPPMRPGVRYVGHGALGVGGRDLRRLSGLLQGSPTWAPATPSEAEDRLVRALLARARGCGVAELLVATGRRDRVSGLVKNASAAAPLDPAASAALEQAVRTATARGAEQEEASSC